MQINGFTNSTYFNFETNRQQNEPTTQIQHRTAKRQHDQVTLSTDTATKLEKFAAYPGWAGKYIAKVNVLNNPDSQKVGYAAWESDFRAAHHHELKEYNSKFKAHYEQAKIEHNINTRDEYYTQVIAASDDNTTFRDSVESKIRGDTRMLELMSILGIRPPSHSA